jgi:hypothetical protein
MKLQSFLFAGFEGTTGYNRFGEWIDQVEATQHDVFVDDDYALLRAVGIRTVRECVRWPLVDRDGAFDFASLRPFVRAARTHGVEVVWDLFHFGFPVDADPFDPGLTERFASYCRAVARFLTTETDAPLLVTPVNEPSYLAWAGGEVGLSAPHAHGRGPELKRRLAALAIAGARAVLDVRADATIVSVDAVCRVVPPPWEADGEAAATAFNQGAVFESWDMAAGRLLPELGGNRACLGVPGMNYYWTNQWELGCTGVPLAADDPRRVPLRALVRTVHARYGGPLAITETAHVDDGREPWLDELADEAAAVLAKGIPLAGVCLYPVLGMPEWHDRAQWTRMGLWDLVPASPTLARRPHAPSLAALARAQRRFASLASAGTIGGRDAGGRRG